MTMLSSIAVVLPIRNYATDAMRRCIASLRMQAPDPKFVDVVLADYGSNTEASAAALALSRDLGARHVWFDERGPWNRSRAINLGVRATTAPIIVTSDADLVFELNFIATIQELSARFKDKEFYAYAPMMDLARGLSINVDDYAADYARLLPAAKERVWSRGNVIFSRKLFERVRGWEEAYSIWGCEDNDFFDRAKRSGAAIVDLKGTTSYLHHWHPSNKRGKEAGAQVARNQIMFWPLEGKIPVCRTGPLANDPALPTHKQFKTPSITIVITDATQEDRVATTRASLMEQTFADVAISVCKNPVDDSFLSKIKSDIVGIVPAGFVFANPDALTWRFLIPLLKGQEVPPPFQWRHAIRYTPERQIEPIDSSAMRLPQQKGKQRAVIVTFPLGRVGSSATMGLLKLMGVSVGSEDRLVAAQPMNPKGFFELKSQEKFLRQAFPRNYPGAEPPPTPEVIAAAVERWLSSYEELLEGEFGGAPIIAVKAQRGLALPFWARLRDHYDVRVLLLQRNSSDHVRSMARIWATSGDPRKRTGGAALIAEQLAVWSKFLDDRIKEAGFNTLTVDFDQLIANPTISAKEIARFLDLPVPNPKAVNDWIDSSLVNKGKSANPDTPEGTRNPSRSSTLPVFNNYGTTKTQALPEDFKAAMLFSRAPLETEQDLVDALAGEQLIAKANDSTFKTLLSMRDETPDDPYFQYWVGLTYSARERHDDAYASLSSAIRHGLTHWRVAWALAQAAAKIGAVSHVDQICRQLNQHLPRFWFARELPKHARGFYAQTDQDTIIERFFNEHPAHSRVFVEVGGFDGVHYSNVRRLQESFNWSGVSIEPVSTNFKKLKKSYENRPVVCVQAAIGSEEGEAALHVSTYPHLPDWGSDVATFVPERRDEWISKFGAKWDTERVRIRTLTGVLEECRIEIFDLLSIDVEGHDLAVLEGLDFSRFKPQLIVIEYGKDRSRILAHLLDKGYRIYHDNGVDLFMACDTRRPEQEPRQIERQIAERLLNPHLLTLVDLPERLTHITINPARLLDARRFDIAVKYLYANFRKLGIECDFAKRAYLAHIAVFNGFNEGDNTGKRGPDTFLKSFDKTLDSVCKAGFDVATSIVPIDSHGVVIDGGHRVAACLAAHRPVDCVSLPTEAPSYNYSFFLNRNKYADTGLDPRFGDAAALTFALLKKNTHVVSLFPAAPGRDADVYKIIERYARIVYVRTIKIRREAAGQLMRQIYENEPWLGTWANNFRGAQKKGARCFPTDGPLRAILIETENPDQLRACKEEIRALYASGQDSVHINDTHAETQALAKIYFNSNSIGFINRGEPKFYPAFEEQFARYRDVLKRSGLNAEHFCIEGSAIMAAFGIRASRDLDYISLDNQSPDFGTKLIGNHASELQHHVFGRDEIIFDPANHFYYFGMKIATLSVLRAMKLKRGETPKDYDDVALIDAWRETRTRKSSTDLDLAPQAATTQPTGIMARRNRRNDIRDLLAGQADVIVDGGANRGDVTAALRQHFPSALIHAFEPLPELAAKLIDRFAQDVRVIVHAKALSAQRETRVLQVAQNLVSSSLFAPSKRLQKYHGAKVDITRSVEVETIALSDAVFSPHIDLLKLDLQGGELAALHGCSEKLLSNTRIVELEAMFVEAYDGQPLFADIDRFLRANGFRLYNLYDLYTHDDGQLLQGDAVYLNTAFFP